MSSHVDKFQEASKKVKTLKKEPGNDVKLNLYALYKQATEGSCKQPKPSMFDLVGKAKWDAWVSLGTLSQDDARKQYAALVDELLNAEQSQEKVEFAAGDNKYEGLIFNPGKDITEIIFNRPNKRNAITTQMYRDIVSALKEATESEAAVTVLTGKGDYYSSGNDLSNFASIQGDVSTAAKDGAELLRDFVAAFIDFPKILVAAVNGPAVGIPVTLLGLCDVVYASDKATFHTPFSLLGQSPEGCSTYLFPKIMGYSKANEILLFSKKFTAAEAKELGLVSEVFPHETFQEDVKKKLEFLSEASKNSMIYAKELSRNLERSILHKANETECERLVERWQSPDCMEALMRFFQRKSKL
ncbi:enoyl-CoA delta isomerase 2-like isoform X2 [Argiope bruennichi]|nr:enoyl-CoA delta isomerase 2-like isoform X2 [Argiope bruennichi]XP_055953280.1 enoyl-CoA delta isomerase 2-like isoform X2 [Argiope bruennichi]XP_055953281.1 enoyl-CoA delta isomerase 2-like isoform X2 [Argiope bruennichi]